MAWFAICMEIQQNKPKSRKLEVFCNEREKSGRFYFFYRALSTLIFHENYLVFSLLILTILNLLLGEFYIPISIIFVFFGATIYFPVMVIEIHSLAKSQYINTAHNNLLDKKRQHDLPNEHFFK